MIQIQDCSYSQLILKKKAIELNLSVYNQNLCSINWQPANDQNTEYIKTSLKLPYSNQHTTSPPWPRLLKSVQPHHPKK